MFVPRSPARGFTHMFFLNTFSLLTTFGQTLTHALTPPLPPPQHPPPPPTPTHSFLATTALLDQLFDVIADMLSEEISGISFDGISFRIDEKLFEVPRDVASGYWAPNDASRVTHQ